MRPDRIALEKGEINEASHLKNRLEEKQRVERKGREKKNEVWQPRWFKQIPEEDGKGLVWVYCGDYWQQREKKEQLLKRGENNSEINSLMAEGIKGSACDFLS